MGAIADIVINDGQGTPAAHTFAPAKTSADYALLEDRAGGIFIGYNKLVFQLARPNGDSRQATRNLKLSIRIETPKMETLGTNDAGVTPPPTVAHRPWVELTAVFPERCSLQDRKDLQAYIKNALANAFVTDAFEKYELPY